MAQLIRRLLKLRREGQLSVGFFIYVFCSSLSACCMRLGMSAFSCWLAKRAQAGRLSEVGVFHYRSVASWVEIHGEAQEVYPRRALTLNAVRRVGFKCKRTNLHSHTHSLALPSVSLNTLRHVEIVGGSEMVFTPEGTVLYDELALGDVNRYGAKAFAIVPHGFFPPYFPAATKDFLQCLYHWPARPIEIPRAVSLLKDHSRNYYHWLLECLPRAILALRQPGWIDVPLLIDTDLPAQFIESLRLLSSASKHIAVPQGLRLPVQELYFPSVMSPTHDYYGRAPRAEDFLIAPEAIALLRESFLSHVPSTLNDMQQCIYIARSGGTHRSITNELKVISTLEKMGFVIVYPGKLSFVEQIATFANAKIIVGPTGAGMANIVFAKPDCKIAILAAATCNANYYLFAQLAQYAGQQIVYVGGKPSVPADLHSHFLADVDALKRLIEEWLLEEAVRDE